MPIGDIRLSTFKIGDIDLSSGQATGVGFNIYENILDPLGPVCEIRVVDDKDALGKTNYNGSTDKDIQISFSADEIGGQASFKFKSLANKNMRDGSHSAQHAGNHKIYDVRGISEEAINCQGNYVQKSYEELTSKMVEDIVKNNFKSKKSVDVQESTKGKRRLVFNNEHPLQSIRKLNTEHVGSSSKSSLFVLFQQSDGGNQKYIFSTFEKLFQQGPVANLKQSTTLGHNSSPQEKQNAILWTNIPDSFFTPTRPLSKTQQNSYNPSTGALDQVDNKNQTYKFADSQPVYNNAPNSSRAVPEYTMKDSVNDKTPTNVADARKNRLDYLSHISQNYGEIEIHGNPAIKLGSMVNIDLFNKNSAKQGGGEKQFNGKALVVSIRHKVKPMGQTPRYTMVLGLIKGSYKEGGGGNG